MFILTITENMKWLEHNMNIELFNMCIYIVTMSRELLSIDYIHTIIMIWNNYIPHITSTPYIYNSLSIHVFLYIHRYNIQRILFLHGNILTLSRRVTHNDKYLYSAFLWNNSILSVVEDKNLLVTLPFIYYRGNMSSIFSSNSEADAPELLENIEENDTKLYKMNSSNYQKLFMWILY